MSYSIAADSTDRLRSFWERAANYLIGSVPTVTGETLALARIIFGTLVLWFWLTTSPKSFSNFASKDGGYPIANLIDQTGLLTLFSSSPLLCAIFYWTITSLLLAFVVGAFTRILYPALVACFWLSALLSVQGHFITPLLLAMTATAVAPWSHRWSVDRLLFRKGAPARIASPLYGYPIWLLGLAIGLTYTTSGLSKLILTEGGWLWETGARNGLIQDMRYAVTDWGMAISNNFWMSLLSSVMSALGQTIYVWACFTRNVWTKYAIGFFVALPFLVGLVLFMGLFWWPWVVLVLMLYLPWRTIDKHIRPRTARVRHFEAGEGDRYRRWFVGAASCMILIQIFAVLSRSEYEPVYSNYPMYSDRMLAGSEHEKIFWSRFLTHDRNYKYRIRLITESNGSARTRDISFQHDLARFLRNTSLLTLPVVGFMPRDLWRAIDKDGSVGQKQCNELKNTVSSYSSQGEKIVALQYAKQYYMLENGLMTWKPILQWLQIDIYNGCQSSNVSGEAN